MLELINTVVLNRAKCSSSTLFADGVSDSTHRSDSSFHPVFPICDIPCGESLMYGLPQGLPDRTPNEAVKKLEDLRNRVLKVK
jgi:hypothetical protein